jgi:hypothetical protein
LVEEYPSDAVTLELKDMGRLMLNETFERLKQIDSKGQTLLGLQWCRARPVSERVREAARRYGFSIRFSRPECRRCGRRGGLCCGGSCAREVAWLSDEDWFCPEALKPDRQSADEFLRRAHLLSVHRVLVDHNVLCANKAVWLLRGQVLLLAAILFGTVSLLGLLWAV